MDVCFTFLEQYHCYSVIIMYILPMPYLVYILLRHPNLSLPLYGLLYKHVGEMMTHLLVLLGSPLKQIRVF